MQLFEFSQIDSSLEFKSCTYVRHDCKKILFHDVQCIYDLHLTSFLIKIRVGIVTKRNRHILVILILNRNFLLILTQKIDPNLN